MTTVLERPAPAAATPVAAARPPLARLVRVEVRKSLSTRSGRTLAGTAALLPAVALALLLAAGQEPAGSGEMLGLLGTLVAMLMLAVGVLGTAGEWTHGNVQTTFLTVPQRGRVMAAKYTAMVLLGAAIGAVVAGTTLGVAALLAPDGYSWAGTGTAVLATIGAAAVMTVVGAGIGGAVGNAPAALTGTYVLLLVVLSILRGVRPAWAENIDPLQAIADLIQGGVGVGRPLAILAGWLVATTVAGIAATRRRAV